MVILQFQLHKYKDIAVKCFLENNKTKLLQVIIIYSSSSIYLLDLIQTKKQSYLDYFQKHRNTDY